MKFGGMGADEVLIFTRGQPAIRARRLQYHAEALFKKRARIEPPKVSDRIITARAAQESREKEADAPILSAAQTEASTTTPAESCDNESAKRPAFLRYGIAAETSAQQKRKKSA